MKQTTLCVPLEVKPESCSVCAVSAPLILRIPGLGGLCHLSVEADGEAIWQMVEKVLSVGVRLLSLGAETGGGQTR